MRFTIYDIRYTGWIVGLLDYWIVGCSRFKVQGSTVPYFRFLLSAFCFLLSLLVTGANGATNSVSSLSTLQTAINNAHAGDTIILANGSYTTSSTIAIKCVGTSNAPILITAQSIGGATIGGNYSFDFQSPAAWVTVQGFYLTNSGSQTAIEYGATHCRLTRNIIQCNISAGNVNVLWYVSISGDDAQFDHNEVRNKNSTGQMVRVMGDGNNPGQVARRVWIHHNYFHDNVYQNGLNNVETVRWGLGALSASSGNGLMEYNLFDRCDGDSAEMISNKSCNNVYRYNTFLNTYENTFKLRQSTNCLVYGNYFSNTLGLVIFGYYHQIYDNYFINNPQAICIGNGDTNVLTFGDGHVEPRYCVIAFNTLINNTLQYWMDTHYIYGAQSNTFANNIIVGSSPAANFQGQPYLNGAWTNNLIWNTTSGNTAQGDMPVGAYTKTNPLVTVKDVWGVLHLASTSPAIGAAAAGFTNVTVDMDGQPRPATGKDIGADQYSSAPIAARFLTTNDVGPFSADSLATAPSITAPPASQTVRLGASATFMVGAGGTAPLAYQWRLNATNNLAGATNTSLTITNAQATNAGGYTVVVTNLNGSVTSAVATLTVDLSPVITNHPASLGVSAGNNATFAVGAGGAAPLAYQWQFNTTNNLVWATNASLTITNAQNTNAGAYTVVVTNAYGSVTSAIANLTVSFHSAQTNSTPGPATWQCPAGVTSIQVECWGGGGAGGSANKTNNTGGNLSSWGGGGAGGAYARRGSVPVTPGYVYNYSIGGGGVNNSTNNGDRVNGTNTTFAGDNGVTVTAAGGQGGASAIATGGGTAGTGSTNGCVGDGVAVFAGGNGATGVSSVGGGGGAGAGNSANGQSASGVQPGLGANGGGSGGGGAVTGNSGTNGVAPGGGGGGARMTGTAGLQAGGTGGAGQIVITFASAAPALTTLAATPIADVSATLNGSITSDGGAALTGYGFYWSATSPVTTGSTKAQVGIADYSGPFSVSLGSLSVNTFYYYRAYAVNAAGTTLDGADVSFCSLASTPAAPTVGGATTASLDVQIGGDANPAWTRYAIRQTNSAGTSYVQLDGILDATPTYQTSNDWDIVTVTGLSASTAYNFQAIAQNGAGVITAFGPSALGTTTAKADQTVTFDLGATLTRTHGDGVFLDTASSSAGLTPVTYSSDNFGVATVDSSGSVTLVGAGTAHILANQPGNANYNAAPQASQAISVNEPPVLGIQLSGTNVLISWPANAESGFVLESTPDLGSPTWIGPGAPVVIGDQNVVTNVLLPDAQFYRLRK